MDEPSSLGALRASVVNEVSVRREIDLGPFTVLIDAPHDADALTRQGVERADPSPGYWAHLWPSAIELARYLAASNLIAPGVRFLEIGCGLGLCGIVGAKRGAVVTMTDFNPDAVAAARRNAELNNLATPNEPGAPARAGQRTPDSSLGTLACEPFDWNTPPPPRWAGAFDLLIASDVLYEPGSAARIARLILDLGCTALIADPARPQSGDVESRFAELGLRAWATPARNGRIMLLTPA
ncbi:MAG: class I SAM-dependent methyltransferase [Phycisphaerales bacterium]